MPREELSSASDFLKDFPFEKKRIRKVVKLSGARREIRFTDGTETVVDRATIHELAKLKGLLVYSEKLKAAKTLAERRDILQKSHDRQMRILENYRADLVEGLQYAAPSIQGAIRARLRALSKTEFGSPLLGVTPATSVAPPNYGPQKTFKVTNQAGVEFRTIRDRRGRVRVVPIVGGALGA